MNHSYGTLRTITLEPWLLGIEPASMLDLQECDCERLSEGEGLRARLE